MLKNKILLQRIIDFNEDLFIILRHFKLKVVYSFLRRIFQSKNVNDG